MAAGERGYDPELAERFCIAVSESKRSIQSICALKGMPSKATIFRWLRAYPDFVKLYEIAKDEQAETFIDEIVEIADTCRPSPDAVKKAKLRIYARIEAAQRIKPKKYGQKLQLSGDGGGPINTVTKIELVPMLQNDSGTD